MLSFKMKSGSALLRCNYSIVSLENSDLLILAWKISKNSFAIFPVAARCRGKRIGTP